MIHRDIGSHGFMTGDDPDPLKDALDLHNRVRSLRALLELQRWQIEVFFKQIKQTLKLADFLGPSANAVQWQIWMALLTYILAII